MQMVSSRSHIDRQLFSIISAVVNYDGMLYLLNVLSTERTTKEQNIILLKTSIPSLRHFALCWLPNTQKMRILACAEREREKKKRRFVHFGFFCQRSILCLPLQIAAVKYSMRRLTLRSLLSGIVLSVGLLFLIFIVTNWRNDADDIDLPPIKCNCPVVPEIAAKAQTVTEPKTAAVPDIQKIPIPVPAAIKTEPPPFPTCNPVTNSSAVQRAIIIYYPSHQSEYFFPEVRWWVKTIPHRSNLEKKPVFCFSP